MNHDEHIDNLFDNYANELGFYDEGKISDISGKIADKISTVAAGIKNKLRITKNKVQTFLNNLSSKKSKYLQKLRDAIKEMSPEDEKVFIQQLKVLTNSKVVSTRALITDIDEFYKKIGEDSPLPSDNSNKLPKSSKKSVSEEYYDEGLLKKVLQGTGKQEGKQFFEFAKIFLHLNPLILLGAVLQKKLGMTDSTYIMLILGLYFFVSFSGRVIQNYMKVKEEEEKEEKDEKDDDKKVKAPRPSSLKEIYKKEREKVEVEAGEKK